MDMTEDEIVKCLFKAAALANDTYTYEAIQILLPLVEMKDKRAMLMETCILSRVDEQAEITHMNKVPLPRPRLHFNKYFYGLEIQEELLIDRYIETYNMERLLYLEEENKRLKEELHANT